MIFSVSTIWNTIRLINYAIEFTCYQQRLVRLYGHYTTLMTLLEKKAIALRKSE